MINLGIDQLYTWIAGFLWPLTRILGLFATAPLFGHRSIPKRVKLGLGIALTAILFPSLPPVSNGVDPLSWQSLFVVTQQVLIGAAMGLSLRIVWSGVEMAGELIGMSMGLGFATFFDPGSQGRSSAISQFLTLILLSLMLTSDLHLLLLETLAESFYTLPIQTTPGVAPQAWRELAYWGSHLFSIGVQISLPIVTALLMINIALGILTRAAPQLNLFGIGFPVTLGSGLLMLNITLPHWTTPLLEVLRHGIELVRQLTQTLQAT